MTKSDRDVLPKKKLLVEKKTEQAKNIENCLSRKISIFLNCSFYSQKHGHIGSNQKQFLKRGSHVILQKYENVEYPGKRVVDIL